MATPILNTKLHIPQIRPNLVSRLRLNSRLEEGMDGKLTLVCAPAGYGKTTLVSAWVEQTDRPVAWLSLGEGENDPNRFLAYFVASLQAIKANIGEGALGVLQSPQPPAFEMALTALINEIAAIQTSFALVLDDYHLITAQPVFEILAFLLNHLPGQMHLVLIGRVDPPLPLSRLRARGQMTEIRSDELRFTEAEATAFLNDLTGLDLAPEEIIALEARTEGWVTGLQLAALSLQGRENKGEFIDAFSGTHHYIIDYLVDEVIARQDEITQTFMRRTSILDSFSAPLCDAVLETSNSQGILRLLEEANLFLVPLDDNRRWYRYHHLFADFLNQRLRERDHKHIPELHQRASKWHEKHGLVEEAAKHALAANDFRLAACLIKDLVEVLWERGEPTSILEWLERLPNEHISSRPDLCIFHAWALFMNGQNEAAEGRLQEAEKALDSLTEGDCEVSQEDQEWLGELARREQRGRVAAVRASIAFRQGDAPGIFHYSNQALEYLPETSSIWRCMAGMVLGMAQDLSGDTTGASRTLFEAVEMSKASGNIYLILSASLHLGSVMITQGRLRQVHKLCQDLIQLAEERRVLHTEMAGCLYDELGSVLCEWNDLDGGMSHLKKGAELSEQGFDVGVLGYSYLTSIRALYTQRDLARAEEIIQKMEKMERDSDVPPWYTSPKEAWKARLLLLKGDLDAVSYWVQERGLDADGELLFMREEEFIILARILFAEGKLEKSLDLLKRLLLEAEKGGRIAIVAQILMIQSLVHQEKGQFGIALTQLERALSLTKPGGYIRLYIDEGEPMRMLLHQAASHGIFPTYVAKLLAAFQAEGQNGNYPLKESRHTTAQPMYLHKMADQLSTRELAVLKLLTTELTGPEIARELTVSINTMRTHTKNIYSKLDVNNRRAAVLRAEELNLI